MSLSLNINSFSTKTIHYYSFEKKSHISFFFLQNVRFLYQGRKLVKIEKVLLQNIFSFEARLSTVVGSHIYKINVQAKIYNAKVVRS